MTSSSLVVPVPSSSLWAARGQHIFEGKKRQERPEKGIECSLAQLVQIPKRLSRLDSGHCRHVSPRVEALSDLDSAPPDSLRIAPGRAYAACGARSSHFGVG
ncbi:hypothetical protein PLICRDRAFT_554971 [Plicaturopsis crispa FD-325 SS-3]|nr:hypothetical protein PLICRDRAFT_554971 [Plicaturopsis crispa FD-325 SS-3]